MKIRYGVNRVIREHGKKKRTEHRNGVVDVWGIRYGDEKAHETIRKAIRAANPGWEITGYAKEQA